ncbi:peptide/nickel transport system ATP-binding protein [Malonomonas rubra DSM 5091]|uniref:Peptide/nickel transport system ATP-binding protein n=1 Tax=Malonomonas rubra DSM 5091 TaxID=1122189 RepID=A0A1M6FER1_MALRU|nr:oligopeptide/dipeptide ABC transporter ATP-binding protein [Malonomonas rubra]SHI96145.1 peptide/nickel transport system ATP-binding protein [Malonomonas rubra DSM 5091]
MPESCVLKVEDLQVYFPVKKGVLKRTVGHVKAVDGVSFELRRGETFGLVGESGCGKTTTGKAIVRLEPSFGGKIFCQGREITHLSPLEMLPLRSCMQMIFQDPYSSLNPRMTIADIIAEPIRFHRPEADVSAEVVEYMEMAGLRKEYLLRYPHEFSGGQRQRIGIARALACKPQIIIADEPVSALDVSIQSQIINLMKTLQRELGLSYLFIAHDLSVVKHISDRVGVMYLGSLVEVCETGELYRKPLHPYTKALFASVPIPDPRKRSEKVPLQGEIPSPLNAPPGCKFQTRCPHATDRCRSEAPKLECAGEEHQVACHYWRDIQE